MRRKKRQVYARLVMILAFCVMALPTGCARNRGGPTPAGPQGAVQPRMTLVVYYPKITQTDAYLVREVHTVLLPQGQAPGAADPKLAALQELITGQPNTSGAFRVLPENTRVLSIKVANGVATVDFSREALHANVGSIGEAMGIQSIVYTLTEFPDVKRVAFTVEGALDQRTMDWWGHIGLYEQPFGRNLSSPSIVREPVIWVTSPQPGAKVGSPLKVTGSAMVFEAVVSLRLVVSDGCKLAEAHVNASAGAPGRGDFSAILTFAPPDSGTGFLEAYWVSPKDGSELDKVLVPVNF